MSAHESGTAPEASACDRSRTGPQVRGRGSCASLPAVIRIPKRRARCNRMRRFWCSRLGCSRKGLMLSLTHSAGARTRTSVPSSFQRDARDWTKANRGRSRRGPRAWASHVPQLSWELDASWGASHVHLAANHGVLRITVTRVDRVPRTPEGDLSPLFHSLPTTTCTQNHHAIDLCYGLCSIPGFGNFQFNSCSKRI